MAQSPPPNALATELAAVDGALVAAIQDDAGWSRAPQLLRDLERGLLSLSAGWQELAALAAPTVTRLRGHEGRPNGEPVDTGLSRGQEVQLISALHDLATELVASARSCRNTRRIVEPLIELRMGAARGPGDLVRGGIR
jgi:hypothetical protein